MSRTSNLEFVRDPNLTLQDPPGTPQAPQEVVFWRFLAFFVGSFVFFVGSSSDRLRTLGTRPGPSERRRITRIRPLNAQRPPEPLQAPPRPRIVVGRPGLTRIVVGRPRETPHAPDAPQGSRSLAIAS
ncbi:hypothetical protein PGTUg99_002990 [Puccinia graminis f. sp. tritici]|uniref:Uncharacterized protein n=1 Tax=Puccinia graminis f. sp. tritici TaxID=56615 RepID=A0A5B0QZ69_PUCGR|nr:hypothetical protein PGTUg99_002990 [Puccinia graminis f. sp. tritici]